MRRVVLLFLALLLALLLLSFITQTAAACGPTPVTADTPSGVAGCERWGRGTASHYAAGYMAAMNRCTWGLRHGSGCGSVVITSEQTGVTVTVPVTDFCDCYFGTSDERIIDLGWDVVAALGLDLAQGLYPVTVTPASTLPNTAMGVE